MMETISRLSKNTHSNTIFSFLALVANLLPLLGIFYFDWGIFQLIFIYWIESITITLVGVVKSATATLITLSPGRSLYSLHLWNRKGSISTGSLQLYPRSVKIILGLCICLNFWLGIGFYFKYFSNFILTYGVLLTGAALIFIHLFDLYSYFKNNRFEISSPKQVAVHSTAYSLLFVAFFSLISVASDPIRPHHRGNTLLIIIFLLKYTLVILVNVIEPNTWEMIEIDGHRFQKNQTLREKLSFKRFLYELPSVAEPNDRMIIHSSPRIFDLLVVSLKNGILTPRAGPLGTFLLISSIPLYLIFDALTIKIFITTVLFSLSVIVFAGMVRTLPQSITIGYRIYDEEGILCYDNWLNEPQWNIRFDDIENVKCSQCLVGSVFGFGSVKIETTQGEEARIAYIRDCEKLTQEIQIKANL